MSSWVIYNRAKGPAATLGCGSERGGAAAEGGGCCAVSPAIKSHTAGTSTCKCARLISLDDSFSHTRGA